MNPSDVDVDAVREKLVEIVEKTKQAEQRLLDTKVAYAEKLLEFAELKFGDRQTDAMKRMRTDFQIAKAKAE